MKKLLGITRDHDRSLGGFVELGQIVFTTQAGALFEYKLLWAVALGTTLVVRTDDNQHELFTYDRGTARSGALVPGARVRVTAGPADENGTRVASTVTVVPGPSSAPVDKGAQAVPVPEKVRDVESDIKRESRRWRLGVRAGAAFDPELFTFGVQSQIGPIFHPRVLFRPNAEFAFGEVTDLIALNFEAIYRFSAAHRSGNWTPYVGGGPAMISSTRVLIKGVILISATSTTRRG